MLRLKPGRRFQYLRQGRALRVTLWAALVFASSSESFGWDGDGAGDKEAAQVPKQDEPAPEGWHRRRFALERGASRVELTGFMQEDFRHFDWQVSGDTAGTKRYKARELRRIRLGFRARFGKTSFDFSAEPRDLPTGSRLKSLSASYAFSKAFGLRAGLFKLPGSKEFNALTNGTDFPERSMIATRLVPERDWGIAASGLLGRVEYLAGVFKGDGSSSSRRTGLTSAGRVAVRVAKGLELSASYLEGEVSAPSLVETAAASPKGALGQTATGFTFWSRPHVSGARRRVSSSLGYSRGPFRVLGEYLEEREGRESQSLVGQDLPDVFGRGWSAQASYVITGETKAAIIEPARSLFAGGAGAIEVVARVQTLRFDDAGDPFVPLSSGNRAANIPPVGASAIEAGVNYWPANFMKVQTSAIWEKYSDPLTAPTPGRPGRYLTLVARVQFMIP